MTHSQNTHERTDAVHGDHPDGVVRTPMPVLNDFPADPTPPAAPARRPHLIRALAVTSIVGLTASVSLPLLTQQAGVAAADAPEAAVQQALFSEVSPDELPAALAEVLPVDRPASTRATYSFDDEAAVNYPFSRAVTLTDGFGYRVAPVEQFHDAQDFAAAAGTPISVIANGRVVEAGWADDGCGFALKVAHMIGDEITTSRYCHMISDSHQHMVGDEVKMGDEAGLVGNTGMSFGPHLHLAIRVDDTPVDPLDFLDTWGQVTRKEAGSEELPAPLPTSTPSPTPTVPTPTPTTAPQGWR